MVNAPLTIERSRRAAERLFGRAVEAVMMRESLLILVLAAAACRPAGHAPAGASTAGAGSVDAVSAAGWTRRTLSAGWREVPPYSVEVPPELERVDVEGIDSDVAWLSGPGIDLHFDYGMYGGFGGCEPGSRCTAGETVIAGRAARTLSRESAQPDEQGRRFFRSVSIPVTSGPAAPPGLPPPPGAISLTGSAQCATAAACDRAEAMSRTIEFRASGPVMPKTKPPPPPPPQPGPPSPTAAE